MTVIARCQSVHAGRRCTSLEGHRGTHADLSSVRDFREWPNTDPPSSRTRERGGLAEQPTASEVQGKPSPAVGHNATTKGEAPTVAAAAYASPRESGSDAASTSAPSARRDGRAPNTETGAGGG